MAANAAQDEWIARVLGATPAGVTSAASDAAAVQAAYDDLLESVLEDLDALQVEDSAQARAIMGRLEQAEALADAEDLPGALRQLDSVASGLAQARGAARTAAAQAAVPAGTVADAVARLEQARGRWDSALPAAQAGAQLIGEIIRKTSPERAEALETVVQSYWDDLAEMLAEASGSADGTARLRAAVAALRAEMAADPLMDELDAGGYPVRPAFMTAFADIEAMVSEPHPEPGGSS